MATNFFYNLTSGPNKLLYLRSSGLLLQLDQRRGSVQRAGEAAAGRSWSLHVHTKVDKTEHHMARKRNPLLQNQKDIYVSPNDSHEISARIWIDSLNPFSIFRFNESLSCGTCNDKLDEVTTLNVPALSAYYKVSKSLSSFACKYHKVNVINILDIAHCSLHWLSQAQIYIFLLKMRLG